MSSPRRRPDRFAIAAFAGWNDAANASTDALTWLADQWGATVFDDIEPDEYHDFQVTRPRFILDGGRRELLWPRTRLLRATSPKGKDIIFVDGVEPSMRWEQFSQEVLITLVGEQVNTLICLGALLADVPHTRPIAVNGTSDSQRLRQRHNLEVNEYTGPTGIVGVLGHFAGTILDLPTATLWAQVPHYVANPPNPKAVLALLGALEELLGEPIPTGDLPEEARAWTEGVDALARSDSDIAAYIAQLEAAQDAADSPDASGEALAREFQRYLQRRDQGGPGR